jgi:hypothetical protein
MKAACGGEMVCMAAAAAKISWLGVAKNNGEISIEAAKTKMKGDGSGAEMRAKA